MQPTVAGTFTCSRRNRSKKRMPAVHSGPTGVLLRVPADGSRSGSICASRWSTLVHVQQEKSTEAADGCLSQRAYVRRLPAEARLRATRWDTLGRVLQHQQSMPSNALSAQHRGHPCRACGSRPDAAANLHNFNALRHAWQRAAAPAAGCTRQRRNRMPQRPRLPQTRQQHGKQTGAHMTRW